MRGLRRRGIAGGELVRLLCIAGEQHPEHVEVDATGPPMAAARRVPESIDRTPDYDVPNPF